MAAVLTPADIGEFASAVREQAAAGHAIGVIGGGTDMAYGYPPQRVDAMLRTERLARVVDYAPADQTITIEAGATLGALQAVLGEHDQRLALDPPRESVATVGGSVATNAFGPRRMRYGTLRDLVVGMSIVRGDGTLVRGGGKVVKNVAGFDVPKLMIGALGTLGAVVSVTLRVHPRPQASHCVRAFAHDAAAVRRIASLIARDRFEPAAFMAQLAAGGFACYVLFEGFPRGVDEETSRFVEALADASFVAEVLESGDAAAFSGLDETARGFGTIRLAVSALPSRFEDVYARALAPLLREEAAVSLYPSVGAGFVGVRPADAAQFAVTFAASRRALEQLGGTLVVLDAGHDAQLRAIDPFGTVPGSIGLMRRLKERFDPQRTFNPGRFIGGI